MNSGLYLILYSCGVVKENETIQLEKFMKIGVVLLILSLLVSLVTLNPIFFVINLSLLSLIPIIRFRVARYIAIVLFIYSIYFLILNFSGNMRAVACGIIQILLLGSGLYFILYSYYVDKKNGIMRKDLFSLSKLIVITVVIAILISFVSIIVFFMSGYDYSSEILLAQGNKEFKAYNYAIQIPLNRYLLIKQNGNNNRICMFWIEEFQPKYFVFNSMLLEKAGTDKFKIIDTHKDKIFYTSPNRIIRTGTALYHRFPIPFSSVNGMDIVSSYSYGYCKNGDGDIKLELKDKNVDLPEDKITWFKSKEPDRQTNYK